MLRHRRNVRQRCGGAHVFERFTGTFFSLIDVRPAYAFRWARVQPERNNSEPSSNSGGRERGVSRLLGFPLNSRRHEMWPDQQCVCTEFWQSKAVCVCTEFWQRKAVRFGTELWQRIAPCFCADVWHGTVAQKSSVYCTEFWLRKVVILYWIPVKESNVFVPNFSREKQHVCTDVW